MKNYEKTDTNQQKRLGKKEQQTEVKKWKIKWKRSLRIYFIMYL